MKILGPAFVIATLMLVGGAAQAGMARQPHLYPLQFGATGTVLFVAGYAVDPTTGVTGECDFKRTHSGSGRGGGYKIYTDYYQGICTWDLFGNPVSETFTKTAGAPVPNPPEVIPGTGNRITYGVDSVGDSTGQTATTTGFVIHSTSDYVWAPVTPITTDAHTPVSFQATLTSTGNLDLEVLESSLGTDTGQPVTVLDDGCVGHVIPPGQTCTMTLDYDASGLLSDVTTAVDAVHVDLTTNAGIAHSFSQSIYVTGIGD